MGKSFPQVEAGEWIQPIRKGYGFACCDCGLVHKMSFRIRKKRVQFSCTSRDNRATGQLRRHRNYTCKPKTKDKAK